MLIIMDSAGRSVRRVGVSRRAIEITAVVGVLVLTVALVMGTHGLWNHGDAVAAERLIRDNASLKTLLHKLQGRLAPIRLTAMQAELSWSQLSAKSGLGIEHRALGVGPLQRDKSAFAGVKVASLSGDVLDLEPMALPLEIDRIHETGQAKQRRLGETLEYFNDALRLLSNTPSIRPSATGFTSFFGKRRDPMHSSWVMHKGLDLGGRVGFPIVAPADGVVIWTGWRGGYGLTVVIDHGFGLQTHYAHLSAFKAAVGDRVERGELIALMGNTGRSTGPHLHYEVRRMGQPIDPFHFVLD